MRRIEHRQDCSYYYGGSPKADPNCECCRLMIREVQQFMAEAFNVGPLARSDK